jgi:tellurite resistance protein TerC
VVGAIALRAAFILVGAALLETFHWVMFVFGALLVVTGIKMALKRHDAVHPQTQSGAATGAALHADD